MTYEFQSEANDSIRLGKTTLPVKLYYGLKPERFLGFFNHLRQDYGFGLNKIEFRASVLGDEKTEGWCGPMESIVNFVVYCNILEEMGVDIHNLVGQIKNCTNLGEIYHADSLATLSFIYKTSGYDIVFPKNGADVTVNGITADLKSRQPQVLRQPRKVKIIGSGEQAHVDIGGEILRSILDRISLRFREGSRQADLLFFDMSEDTWYGTIDLYGLAYDKMPDKIPEPLRCRLVFYQTRFCHVTAGPRMFRIGDFQFPLPKRMFPNLHEFRGYWIDIEPSLWKILPWV